MKVDKALLDKGDTIIYHKQINKTMLFIYCCLLIVGVSSIWFTVLDTQKDIKKTILEDSRIIASILKQSKIRSLHGLSSDTSLSEYQYLKQQMFAARTTIVDCRFIYLLGLKKDSIFFYVDSEPTSSKDCSPPGQIYTEAPQSIRNVFKTKQEYCEGPFTDRWGTWVSGFIPIREPENGKVIAVLGVDVASNSWDFLVLKDCALPVSLVLLALLFMIWSFALGRKARIMKYKTNLLSENEEKFRKMFSTHKSVMLLINPNTGTIESANNSAVEFYGYSNEQLCSMNISEINCFQPETIKNEMNNALIGNKNKFIFEHKLANGTKRFVEVHSSPIETINGEYLFSIINDITESKRAEESLIESVNLNQSLLQTIPFGMDIVDEHGNILFINDSLKLQVQYKNEGQKCWELYRDDKKQCLDCPLFTDIKIGETQSYISHNVMGGRTFEIVHTGMIFQGKKAMLEIFIDITERLKADVEKQKVDAKLRTLIVAIEQSPVTTVITDIKGNIEYVNPKFTESTGYSFEEAIGQNPRILKTETISSSEYKDLWETILSGNSWHGTFQNKKKNGELYWESAVISPVKDDKGTITHFLAVKEDITLRKQIEDDLLNAKNAAEAASISKSEFLATMSHEIRTPLNGIIGFSEILLKTKLTEQQIDFAKNVNISAISLLDLINDILDFSKIEAGKLDLISEKVDIITLSENIIDILKFRVAEKGIELLLNISSSVPRFMYIDPVRLRQVLVNLLGNAIKFTEEGEVELKIEAAAIAGNEYETNITFSIRDTGIGIALQKQNEIFNAFSQADSSTSRKYGGTGLGLSISSNLVGKMGSHIQIKSEEGLGSCFFFTVAVPFEYCEKCNAYDLSWAKKVLIVDDNASNRTIVEKMLQSKMVQCNQAANGIVALEMIDNSNDFDVVIVDYKMPYVNGIDVIRNIRANEKSKNQSIILMHNILDDEKVKSECKELGVRFVLQKPLRIMQLYDTFMKIHTKVDVIEEQIIGNDTFSETSFSDRKCRILLVDDNQMNLNLVSSLVSLTMPNVEILKTKKSTEVLELYTKQKPDIILLDIQMPVMNGYEVAREIRASVQDYKKRVPIIALTAGTVAGERERCIEAGMDDYLSKPINSTQLFATFDKYLNGNAEILIEHSESSITKLIHFDKTDVLKTYDNDEQIVNTFLKMAFESMPQYISDLQIAIINNDFAQIKFNAHTLKGMARGICFSILADFALQLEKNFQSDQKNCLELFDQITTEFDFLKHEYCR